jgi:glycosyltransferase involved in cell wall biosynthesis
MRLMFVITRGDDLGGAQSYLRDLTRRFAADGHDLLVVTGNTGALTDALAESGIPTARCSGLLRQVHPVNDMVSVRRLAAMIRSFQPELVSLHSSKAGTIGRVAARLAGVPCVFTVHGWAFIETVPPPVRVVYRLLERGCAQLTQEIICVSDQVRRMGIDAGIDPAKLTLIHNGLPDLPAELRARPEASDPVAIMVARFAPPKDHATVIRAMASVPGLRLQFVGDGPLEPQARALVRELGLENRVAFLGRRSDVPELLARARIFVLSSRSEAFPISTLEAMRAGLPVVVSDAGGAGEAVRDGETGFLFAPSNAAALAERLARLAADARLRATMGAAGRRLYETEFTFEQMYRRTLAVYESALGAARRRVPVLEG